MPPSRLIVPIPLLILLTVQSVHCQDLAVTLPPALEAGADAQYAPDAADPPAAGAPRLPAPVLGNGWTWRGSERAGNAEPRGLARLTQRLGDPRVVAPALLAGYLTGRITGLPDFSAASARVAGATLGAALLSGGLESATGSGPRGTAGRLEAALPAADATIAFAAAAAIHAESPARWVPWVVYPAAAAAGWTQAWQNGEGLGGVAAGAALGIWAGRTLDRLERGQVRILDRARFLVRGSPRNFRLGFKARF